MIVDTIAKIAATGRWHIRLLGDLNRLPQDIRSRLLITVEQTLDITDSTVNIAIAYSGRDEITRGIRKLLMARRAAGTLDHMARYVTPDDVNTYLDTAGQSDPDLVIRTAGEKRLSGFLPWQTVYTELYFTDILWPDFTPSDLTIAMQDYSRRIRREGR
ncbi:hypothetical protein AWN90_04270 [Nocardia terpenica]|uniref:Di-trans,poly-cis-decaprenylcistransferase n=1 Tax=Nocardia terpenica TaxID=455432 RepID=A0A164IXF1_9NOCA|nr:hypothetical protein AWN90_04270 [Nocardia terpenica]